MNLDTVTGLYHTETRSDNPLTGEFDHPRPGPGRRESLSLLRQQSDYIRRPQRARPRCNHCCRQRHDYARQRHVGQRVVSYVYPSLQSACSASSQPPPSPIPVPLILLILPIFLILLIPMRRIHLARSLCPIRNRMSPFPFLCPNLAFLSRHLRSPFRYNRQGILFHQGTGLNQFLIYRRGSS